MNFSMYLNAYPSVRYMWTGCGRNLRAIGCGPDDDNRVNLQIHSEAVIKQDWRSSWSPWLWEPEGLNRGSLEINLEAVVEPVSRCTCMPWSSKFGDMHLKAKMVRTWRPQSNRFRDALGCRERVSLQIHLEAAIEWVWRCIRRPWSYELGGHTGASLDEYLEGVDGQRARCWTSFRQLVDLQLWDCEMVTLPLTTNGKRVWCRSIV